MAKRRTSETAALRFDVIDRPEAITAVAERVALTKGRIRALTTVRRLDGDPPLVEIELEVEGVTEPDLVAALEGLDDVRAVHLTRALDRVFGKRIIVVGGGAQVAQVALGAVTEADRHNLRGELISVDTIPLVGEGNIAAAVRAVADLPRARLLVLAGSIMGGDISVAADELRAVGIPIIALNMVGSITDHVDLVVSDPVQAGTMAVMAIAETATFDLERQRGRRYSMRIATWNVNSLKARQDAVENWLTRAEPDILLIQETKLTDEDAPVMAFAMAGYQLVHHGEGRWNGVAIAARNGLAISDVVTNFGDGPVRDSGPGGAGGANASEDDFDPFDEARMVAATVDGLRLVSIYAPNGRVVDSPFYLGKLAWFDRLARWIKESDALDAGAAHAGSFVIGGDFNVAPTPVDVWDPAAAHGGTHVSERERAAVQALMDLGLTDGYRARHDEPGRYTWWDYRAGMFHKNFGMRIDLLLCSAPVAARIVDAEIDRQARKGPPVPLDHAPLTIDLDEPGRPLDVDWAGALSRIAARTR